MSPQLLDWLRGQQHALDGVLACAAEAHFSRHVAEPRFLYDVRAAELELLNLSNGKDLCYDRPSIGVTYAMWYHARRVNTSLELVAGALEEAEGERIELVDLGAGTGAMQWAVGVVSAGMEALGRRPPEVHVVNVDASPFMLDYLRPLWEGLVEAFPSARVVAYEREVNTWLDLPKPEAARWLSASYLFDHSDKSGVIVPVFAGVINRLRPSRFLLSTSNQPPKVRLLNAVKDALVKAGYVERPLSSRPFEGPLTAVNALRERLRRQHGVAFNPRADWSERSFVGATLLHSSPEFGLRARPADKQRVDLFIPPIRVRREVRLNEEQQKAARFDGRPTIVVGPAGCGKSVVLTEMLKNIVEAERYSPSLSVLVTTFNKGLLGQLGDWTESVLDRQHLARIGGDLSNGALGPIRDYYFRGSSSPNVRLLHFDVLPTRIGGVRGDLRFENDHLRLAERAVEKTASVVAEKGHRPSDYAHVLDPVRVLEEHHRVYYGLWQQTEEKYLHGPRDGYPRRLMRGSVPRQILWSAIRRYIALCKAEGVQSLTSRRLSLLNQLLRGRHNGEFSHILVDEFQDCTPADFWVFYKLIQNPDHLVIAGDVAQAVHIGWCAKPPPRLKGEQQARRRIDRLNGSYRLPLRITECLTKLSEHVAGKHRAVGDGADTLNAYKGSPPGARPIVVWAGSTDEMAARLHAVACAYAPYDISKLTILEADRPLLGALRRLGASAETDTVLRIKGLEKTCVIWSTRQYSCGPDEVEETAYTVLTRTCGLLVIALFDDTHAAFKPVLGALNDERLLFWDAETQQRFPSFCEGAREIPDVEEPSEEAEEDVFTLIEESVE